MVVPEYEIESTFSDPGFVAASVKSGIFSDEEKGCALLCAVFSGNIDLVKLLLAHQAPIKHLDTAGESVLYYAALKGHHRLLKVLLQHGADIDQAALDGCTPLLMAVSNGYTRIVRTLLEAGANVSLADQSGRTPIYWAANCGSDEIIKLLADHGADVSKPSSRGYTPLHRAAMRNLVKTTRILLDLGADCTISSCEGFLPSHCIHDYRILKLLHDYGADVKLPVREGFTYEGRTALHHAAECGKPKMVETLLEYGAPIDQTNIRGESPLIIAAKTGNIDIIKTLLGVQRDEMRSWKPDYEQPQPYRTTYNNPYS